MSILTSTERRSPLIDLVAVLTGVMAALILTADFWLRGAPGVFTADTLLPVAFVHELQHHLATIGQFQLPRIPSLFPDLAVYALLASVVADFRQALFGTSLMQVALFLIPASFVVTHVSARPALICTLSVCLVAAAALTINVWAGGVQYFIRMFAIFEHFGPFCLSLISLLIVLRLLGRQSLALWIVLTFIQTLAIASNKSYVLIYVGPCFVALILEWRRRAVSPSLVLRWALCVAIAGAAAMLLLAGLELQPVPGSPKVLVHVIRYASGLVSLLVESPLAYVLLILAPLVHMLLFPWTQPALYQTPPARFVWTVACLATLVADSFCAAFYEDYGSLRYITASVFWPLIFVAASLATWAAASPARSLATFAVAIASFAAQAGMAISSARSFHGWRQPLADCLIERRQTLGLKDGLAEYWLARPVVIGSAWSLQIEQITEDGYYRWGNNPYWETHSTFDTSKPPQFNYILPGKLDPQGLSRHFGQPSRIEQCDGNPIWVYDGNSLRRP